MGRLIILASTSGQIINRNLLRMARDGSGATRVGADQIILSLLVQDNYLIAKYIFLLVSALDRLSTIS